MKYEIIEEERVYEGFLSVVKAKVKFETFMGEMRQATRLMMSRGDSVAILLFEKDTNTILLTNQFRYPAAEKDESTEIIDPGWLLELPAGGINKDEDPMQAGRREVQEELGYKVPELQFICIFYVSPGGTSERIHLYFAEVRDKHKTSKGGGVKYEKEDIALHKLPIDEIEKAIALGVIRDAKTIIGLQWFLLRGFNQS